MLRPDPEPLSFSRAPTAFGFVTMIADGVRVRIEKRLDTAA
jgi:hypothetical protein